MFLNRKLKNNSVKCFNRIKLLKQMDMLFYIIQYYIFSVVFFRFKSSDIDLGQVFCVHLVFQDSGLII